MITINAENTANIWRRTFGVEVPRGMEPRQAAERLLAYLGEHRLGWEVLVEQGRGIEGECSPG